MHEGLDASSVPEIFTGDNLPSPIQVSGDMEGRLFLRFVSDSHFRFRGFKIEYEIIGSTMTTTPSPPTPPPTPPPKG